MRILVTGDRNWECYVVTNDTFKSWWPYYHNLNLSIILGGCPSGVDLIFGQAAYDRGIPVEIFKAKWDLYGRKAGPIRNQEMVDSHPDICYAIHRNIKQSKGTIDCLKRALKAGIPCFLIDSTFHEKRRIRSLDDLDNKG